ncbi:Leucine-rich repeat domain-containing protein [Vibrio crassostreae]|nr:Leucine-rich repeat domain-containing protein [Vibrio crassostreae]
MNFNKSILFLSTLLTLSAQAEFVAIVIPPEGMYTEPSAALKVTQNDVVGTYEVVKSELHYSDIIVSDEGCDVLLDGDEKSGKWEYLNSGGCSDNDSFTLTATGDLSETISLWAKAPACQYWNNGWLKAAQDGSGTGLVYNSQSCSINNSDISSLMSYDSVPAYYLNSIHIDAMGGEGGEGGTPAPDEGEGEGAISPEFNLPNIQYVFGDITVDHPFLEALDLSNLRYAGSNIILRGMNKITKFDLSKLSYNYYNINVMGAMFATELDISNVENGGRIDISYTSISNITKFANLKYGLIITNNDNEAFFPQVTTFPNRNSNFCKAVRWGDVTLSSSISQANAENACQ